MGEGGVKLSLPLLDGMKGSERRGVRHEGVFE